MCVGVPCASTDCIFDMLITAVTPAAPPPLFMSLPVRASEQCFAVDSAQAPDLPSCACACVRVGSSATRAEPNHRAQVEPVKRSDYS